MKLYCIASGSSGNCLYFETGGHSFLIDAGISSKRILQAIEEAGLKLPEAVFVTHEHSDHIMGLEVFLKKNPIPVYATGGTLAGIAASFKGIVPRDLFLRISPGKTYNFFGVNIRAYDAPHDAAEPVFYVFSDGTSKAAVITDIGFYTDEFVEAANGANLLYLESNHDPAMLLAGRYPYSLKQRVLGERGHLSNDSAAEFAVKLLHPDLKAIMLGHLSKENNYPELAYETMRGAVCKAWSFEKKEPLILVANRDIPTGPIEF